MQNYTGGYDINTLFTEWNLYSDLQINTSTGTTNYGKITGSDKKDLIFITGDSAEIEVKAGTGVDYVSAGGGINYIHLGKDDTRDVIANDNDFYTIKKSA